MYFMILVCSAWFAVAHNSEAVMDRWEVAKVSTQIASQTNNSIRPWYHGDSIGTLTIWSRPVGSSREGTLAEDKALCRISFIQHVMVEVAASTKTITVCAERVHI